MKITKKTEERIKTGLAKFQKVLGVAKDRDLNESDTVNILTDILSEIFGYDKYLEVTSELAIRGTYCDLAIKVNDKFEFLIEAKAIGIELKENHLRQAIGYGANKGIQWVVLTNGIDWQVYRLRFEQPIQWDLIARFNMAEVNVKDERELEKLFILTKEGLEKNARGDLYEKIQCVNRFVCGQLILNDYFVGILKRELRKLAEGIAVDDDEVRALLREGVLRRDLLEGEESDAALAKVTRFYRQQSKKSAAKPQPVKEVNPSPEPAEKKPEISLTEQLLAEAEAGAGKPAPVAPVQN